MVTRFQIKRNHAAARRLAIFSSIAQLKRTIGARDIRHIDLKFTDLFGRWHHLTLPASGVGKTLFTNGLGFDGSNFPGMKSLEAGDLSLVPDIATGFVDPFREEPTISFLCRIVEADTKKAFSRDPRGIAEHAETYLRSTRIADRSMWGPEFEYYIFDEVAMGDTNLGLGYEISPAEGDGDGRVGLLPFGGYHALPPGDSLADIRDRTVTLLEDAGVRVIYHHHEVGGHGQVEIETAFDTLTRSADISMMVRYFARMTAHQAGKTATFMPKPVHGEAGSGMHFHQHLFKSGKPLFWDAKGYGGLSVLARRYVAGLLVHAPALLALTNPSTNSYKRLIPGFEAPVHSFYSLANRSAAIRIPKYANSPASKRIEFRPPDATCNSYLAMAAQLMAGIDGIRRKLDPGKLGFGPYDVNMFDMDPEERGRIAALPGSLEEALDALEADHGFLLAGDVFSAELVADWIRLKRERDVMAVRNRTHPLEIKMYLDC
ncbi:MAG: type I glutamate--ammonia ligase [Candidatus Krumholzibacteriota bacterium]|nr:type I glutamate--ammonia ligase [Candidatus Krumholzibacteriota bacterium]